MLKKVLAIVFSCSLLFSNLTYGAEITPETFPEDAVVYNFTINDGSYSITTKDGVTPYYTYGSGTLKAGHTMKLFKKGGYLYNFVLEHDVILTVNLNTVANVEMGYYDEDDNFTETFTSSVGQKSHCTFIHLEPGNYGFYITNLEDVTVKMKNAELIDG